MENSVKPSFLGIPNSKFQITLTNGYRPIDAVAFLIATGIAVAGFAYINSSQTFVLSQIIGVPSSVLGDYSGSLVFYDQLVVLVVSALWGVVSGSACVSVVASIIADITVESDRGKLSGAAGVISGLGAVLAVSVLLPLPNNLGGGAPGLRKSFAIVAGLVVLCAIFVTLLSFFLRKPEKALTTHPSVVAILPNASGISINDTYADSDEGRDRDEVTASEPEPEPSWTMRMKEAIREGILAARDERVVLGLVGAYMARSDSISITLFIPLWVYKYYIAQGICAPGGSVILKQACPDAFSKSGTLSGVTQTFALVSAPLFGYLLDRYSKKIVFFTSACVATVGYFVLSFQKDPTKPINFIYLFLIGVGEMGLIVSSLTLLSGPYIPVKARGSVAGFSSVTGGLGVLVSSKVGGYLFDVSGGWPFLFLAIVHSTIITALLLFLFLNRKLKNRSS
ncbi:hypothetical protein HDV03_003186 [Kappamyces sp. JEL0829]|nr:hypothetical protein HDV03_003186 [Kappamyces sp. JEL0829]